VGHGVELNKDFFLGIAREAAFEKKFGDFYVAAVGSLENIPYFDLVTVELQLFFYQGGNILELRFFQAEVIEVEILRKTVVAVDDAKCSTPQIGG